MLLSAAGLVLALIAWAIAAIWGSLLSGPKGGEPQKLFNTESRNEDEKPR
jgi:hypothetical protein